MKKKDCNCQFENGYHSRACPLFVEPENPMKVIHLQSNVSEKPKSDTTQESPRKKHKHDYEMIDVLRTKCRICGKFFETNPYTGKIKEISKKAAMFYIPKESPKAWEENWEEEFDRKNIAGNCKNYQKIIIKQFIRTLLSAQTDNIIRQFAMGEFVQSDIAKKFAKEVKKEIIEEILKEPKRLHSKWISVEDIEKLLKD